MNERETRLAMVNAPEGYAKRLAQELPGIELTTQASGEEQAALVFVNTLAEAEKLAPEAGRAASGASRS